MMKKILLFILLFAGLITKAQFPNTVTGGNSSTLNKQLGAYGANLGYVWTAAYSDTTAANLSFIKNVPGIVIRIGNDLWMRSANVLVWIKISGSGSGGFFSPNQTSTGNTLHDGSGYDFVHDSASNIFYHLKRNGTSQFDIFASRGFSAFIGDISGSYYGYYDLWKDFNEFYLGINGGETMINQSPSSSGSSTLIWSKLGGQGSFLNVRDTDMYLDARNGKLKFGNLKHNTGASVVGLVTDTLTNQVHRAAIARYNFTGLANWDKLRYNSSSSEWNNFNSTRTDPTTITIKMLVKDTVTNQEYYTDLPVFTVNDTTRIIQELSTLSDLDLAIGNVAVIDGRLWVKYDTTWRRQAYDTTYIVLPPVVPILDTYTGALGAYSLRKLRTGQTNCIRVRRSSDNAEQTIGFDGDDVDLTSLTAFIGANTGFVTIWYDQSGNSNDFAQPTSFRQPTIIESGVLQTTNGKATINFGDQTVAVGLELPTGFLNSATSLSYFQVAKITDFGSSNAGVFAPSTTNSVGLEIVQHTVISRRSLLRINGTARNDNFAAGYQLWDDATQSLTSIFGNSTDVTAYKNSSSVTMTNSAAMPSLNFNGVYVLGWYNSTTSNMYGDVQELIIYNTNKTSSRTGIEANINSFYTIY